MKRSGAIPNRRKTSKITEEPSVAEQRGAGADVPGDVKMNPQSGNVVENDVG